MGPVETPMEIALEGVRPAQRAWERTPVRKRVAVVRELRQRIAVSAQELAETIPTSLPGALQRTVADSLVAEVLPLIEACRFLEREAERVLRTRNLGNEGRPVWLGDVATEVQRIPWGVVLVIGAANYPLLLAGVQTLQALTAGNAVLWKPAPGTEMPAHALLLLLLECGLPAELLTILRTDASAAEVAIVAGVEHVVLTGSVETGKAVLRRCAETLTPATMELSGCDAMFVLPGADLDRAVAALAFGLRFNGSCTCMAPRRVFLVGMTAADASEFEACLAATLEGIAPVAASQETADVVRSLLDDARSLGAEVLLDGLRYGRVGATLIRYAVPSMRAMQTGVFAPVLSLMRVASAEEALAADAACVYALSASVFGPEKAARAFAGRLRVGNVLINDLIVSTADPRVAFGGRGQSGFGVTRGVEGLLAMTTQRTIQVQHGRSRRAYEPTGDEHVALFAGLAQWLHGDWKKRWTGLMRMLRAARRLK